MIMLSQLLLVSWGAVTLLYLHKHLPFETYSITLFKRTFLFQRRWDILFYIGHMCALGFLWHIVVPIFRIWEQEHANNQLLTRGSQPVKVEITRTYFYLAIAFCMGYGHMMALADRISNAGKATTFFMETVGTAAPIQGLMTGILLGLVHYLARPRFKGRPLALDTAVVLGSIMMVSLPVCLIAGMGNLLMSDTLIVIILSIQVMIIIRNPFYKTHHKAP